ncbi:MAG TPA: hypothetical protein VFL95_09895, partial [Gemmatimonadales bacterium]|nr:hypothetical protein [Gemmatimonadales bacterium]
TARPRGTGSRIVRRAADGTLTTLVETQQPVLAFVLSRDGKTMVYVTGQITDAAKGTIEYAMMIQPTTPGAAPVAVPLQPHERVIGPAF